MTLRPARQRPRSQMKAAIRRPNLQGNCLEAAESMRDMLHELNAMTEYKTKPYLEKRSGKPAGDTMILDFKPES